MGYIAVYHYYTAATILRSLQQLYTTTTVATIYILQHSYVPVEIHVSARGDGHHGLARQLALLDVLYHACTASNTYIYSQIDARTAVEIPDYNYCHCCLPAMASAPAGSSTQRVSLKQSLMAEQISSVFTVTMPSTRAWHTCRIQHKQNTST